MENEDRSEAARRLGSARTPAKVSAARAVAASRRGTTWTPEQKANLKAAQQARREREREEKARGDQTGSA